MMNKEAIHKSKNEIHFYKDEIILNMKKTPPQYVKIIDINHIKGEVTVNNLNARNKKSTVLSFSDIKKQLYNNDMIYVRINKDLEHFIFKTNRIYI